MRKILFLLIIVLTLMLSACSLEGESPVYSHLQNQDPSKVHKGINDQIEDTEIETEGASDPRCIGQYTAEDITNRDLEKRAVIENRIDLCYEMPEQPLVVECPDQVTLVYYSKARCLELLS